MRAAGIKNQAELCRRLKIKSPSVTSWKRGEWGPKPENYLAMSLMSGISVDYLMTGKGRKFTGAPGTLEERVIDALHQLPEDRQKAILDFLDFELHKARQQ